MHQRNRIGKVGLVCLIGTLAIGPAQADITWDGSDSASWGAGGNWVDDVAPGAGDVAVFNSAAYVNQPQLDADTVHEVLGLNLGGPSAAALVISTTSSAYGDQLVNGAVPNNSSTIVLDSTADVVVGQRVSGTRIGTNTFVTAINGNEITLSRPTTGGTLNDNTQLTFYSSLRIGSEGVTVAAGTTGIQDIAATVVLNGNQTWTNNATLTNALRISGGIYLGNHTLTLSGVAGSSINLPLSGALNGEGSLIIDTEGSVSFGQGTGGRPLNTFSGGVTLESGTLVLSGGNAGGTGVAGALGTGVLTINGGQINGAGNIASYPLTISGQVWNADWTYLSSRNLNMGTGDITLGTAAGTTRTVTVNSGGTDVVTLGGGIHNGTTATNFTKAGGGEIHLQGVSTYTGATTIAAGNLKLDGAGSIANSHTINVVGGATFDVSTVTGGFNLANGQTLMGTGTVIGDVTVASGATLAPGASAGTLVFTSSVLLQDGSSLSFELNGADQTVGGGINDLINGVVDLTLAGTLNVSELVAGSFLTAEAGDTWRLFNYSGTLTDDGITLGSTPALSSGLFLGLDTATAGEVNLVVLIPEPASLMLLAAGGLLLMPTRQRA